MDFSPEMELALVTLNELDELAHTLRHRLKSTPEERERSFENFLAFKSALPEENRNSTSSVSERVNHDRFLTMKDRQRERVARRTMFASGFSALERFLVLRTPDCNPKSNFSGLAKKLETALGLETWNNPEFKDKWDKLDFYRVARNKILHQCALVTEPGSDCDEKALLAANLSPVFLETVEGHKNLKEIQIKESFLGDYFRFLQDLAIEVDAKLRGVPSC